MTATGPIDAPEMAGIVRQCVDAVLGGGTEPAQGAAFELYAAATGQRFRVVVAEIAAWTDRMDGELAAIFSKEEAA